MKRSKNHRPQDAAHDTAGTMQLSRARFAELRTSPLGNLLLEDAAAAKQHGRMTARIGVLEDGNPIIYSTDPVARDAIVRAVQQRAHVNVMNIPEVSEADFAKLLREGVGALPPRNNDATRAAGTAAHRVPVLARRDTDAGPPLRNASRPRRRAQRDDEDAEE